MDAREDGAARRPGARRRREVGPPCPAPARRKKLNLSLDPETYRRLKTYAVWHGKTCSAVVLEATEALLRRFVVTMRSEVPPAIAGSAAEPPTGGDVAGPRLAS